MEIYLLYFKIMDILNDNSLKVEIDTVLNMLVFFASMNRLYRVLVPKTSIRY